MMKCCSQLLSNVLKHYDAYRSDSDRGGAFPSLRISTHPLLPEIVDQDLTHFGGMLSDLLLASGSFAAHGNPVTLYVEPGRGVADLCVLKFKLQFEAMVPEVEYLQIIKQTHDNIAAGGAWVHVSSIGDDLLEVLIEVSVKAVLPQAVSAFPSWLFGRAVLMIGNANGEFIGLQHSFQQTGGVVSHINWEGASTVRMLSHSMEGDFRHAFTIVEMNSITTDVAKTEAILRQFVLAGLVVDSFDIAFVVSPGVWEKLSDLVKVQIGQRLLQHPLTSHLLKSPKSVMYQASNLSLREMVLNPANTDFLDLNVLLVEDCQLTCSLISNYLTSRGARIFQAHDSSTGLKMARQQAFDLYLVDLHLPDEAGFELARELRRSSCNTVAPILAITASRSVSDYQTCYLSGMDDCLTKPLNFSDMVAKVKCWTQSQLLGSRLEAIKLYQPVA